MSHNFVENDVTIHPYLQIYVTYGFKPGFSSHDSDSRYPRQLKTVGSDLYSC